MDEKKQSAQTIRWYRTPLDKETMKSLTERSDLLGLLQSVGHLALMLALLAAAAYCQLHGYWIAMACAAFLYCTVATFCINAVHELIHGTVFKTKPLNAFFAGLFDLIGNMNHRLFWESHKRHHKYTLHQPDDLEVVEPESHHDVDHFFRDGIINLNFLSTVAAFEMHYQILFDKLKNPWQNQLMREASDKDRRAIKRWSAICLASQAALWIVGLASGLWIVPVAVTFDRQFGGGLQSCMNSSQHAGLQDSSPDFRTCCRTIYVNPLLQFLYWHMNYHIEHHMYAAVPCYRLGRLHKLIKHDLPPTKGLIGAWREIMPIIERQRTEPDYRYVPPLPKKQAA